MATWNGREARVTVDASTTEKVVAEFSSWDIDRSSNEIPTNAFGSTWGKSDVGMKKWSGTVSGFYDPTDTDGQAVLEAAFEAGSLLSDIRFYVNYTETSGETLIYLTPDTATDANAGARITSLKTNTDMENVAQVNFSFSGSGPLKRVVETVA